MDKLTPEVIWYLFVFVMPGFLAAFWLKRFVPLRPESDNSNLINGVFLSLLMLLPIFLWFGWHGWLPHFQNFSQMILLLLYFLVCPLCVGIVFSKMIFNSDKKPWSWPWSILERIVGIRPINPIASAWDNAFLRDDNPWILVTLKSGKLLGARWDEGAIASTDPGERDLYLRQVYSINEDGEWVSVPRNLGTLIKADQIAAIDFLSDEKD